MGVGRFLDELSRSIDRLPDEERAIMVERLIGERAPLCRWPNGRVASTRQTVDPAGIFAIFTRRGLGFRSFCCFWLAGPKLVQLIAKTGPLAHVRVVTLIPVDIVECRP